MTTRHPLLQMNAFERLEASVELIKTSGKLFILKDEHGCVMLTTDDEDGIPVWPESSLALLWATEDWSDCEAMEISTKDFLNKWVGGMTQDNLTVMVCPVPGEEGEVMEPEEFAQQI